MEKAYAALKESKSDEKGIEVLACNWKVKSLEEENTALQIDHMREVRRLSDRNVALERKIQSLGAEVLRLDEENQRLRKKLNDYYNPCDSDSDDTDYGASYKPAKPKPKKTDDDMGWGAALGAVGLGLVGAAGVAGVAALMSSSDDKKKSKKDSSWF
jgi:regulator of replication initiation timing